MPRAFYWRNGTMTALPNPGAGGSHALDVSDNGTIVGVTDYGASIWRDGLVVNLNDLIPHDAGLQLDIAWAINEQGQIAGQGHSGFEVLGFLLTPAQAPPGDVNCDGVVSDADFYLLLDAWGTCGADCPSDIDADGMVGILDFLLLLSNWTA
jgi:hypothetical protein